MLGIFSWPERLAFFQQPEQFDFSSGNADYTPHSLPLKTRVLWWS
jgi:hypothetical protein